MLKTLLNDLKQWLLYPEEFRIQIPKDLDVSSILLELKKDNNPTELVSEKQDSLLGMACEVGTLIWRIRRRVDMDSKDIPSSLKRVSRDLESTWYALLQGGLEIKDHTGQDYEAGMALKVIASQPVASLNKQQIIDTLKPTIYFGNKIVQMGEVVIGIPDSSKQ